MRARFLGISLVAGLPLALVALPVPNDVKPPGVVVGATETVIRAEVSGFLSEVRIKPGESIEAGTQLMVLTEPALRKLSNGVMNKAGGSVGAREGTTNICLHFHTTPAITYHLLASLHV